MKTYTIKPLEWVKNGDSHSSIGAICFLVEKEAIQHWELYASDEGNCGVFTSLKAAKAKAQELHEHELAKYLQEVE